jgi:hypothetical protein
MNFSKEASSYLRKIRAAGADSERIASLVWEAGGVLDVRGGQIFANRTLFPKGRHQPILISDEFEAEVRKAIAARSEEACQQLLAEFSGRNR